MAIVVNERADPVEVPRYYEWSWPDHPREMNGSEARVRTPRGGQSDGGVDAPLTQTELAEAYGKLLAKGGGRIQQRTLTGDNLPRDTWGSLLEVKQQMAAEIAERRNNLEPGVYATQPIGEIHEPEAIPNEYGAVDGRQLATLVPSQQSADRAIRAIRHNDAAKTSYYADNISSCIGIDLYDGGQTWREAIDRGRRISGSLSAVDAVAKVAHLGRDSRRGRASRSAGGPHLSAHRARGGSAA